MRARQTAEEAGIMHMPTTTKRWTLEELHNLPDDGNKYELVRGDLFVTPPPTTGHETTLARLTRILEPFVREHRLGLVYHPRAVVRYEGSEVEPDLMVRQPPPGPDTAWEKWALPILIVEVLSGATRRRDREQKRDFYMDAGLGEYWIVDPERRAITAVRAGRDDLVARNRMTWAPEVVAATLTFDLDDVFR
jgi:Uma2 family endonuclease